MKNLKNKWSLALAYVPILFGSSFITEKLYAVSQEQLIPAGEEYNKQVMEVTKQFNRLQKDQAFAAASTVLVPSGIRAASICIERRGSDLFRFHSHNANAQGQITSALDIDAFNKLFQAKVIRGTPFVLNVPKNLDGSSPEIKNRYVGIVFLQNGDGTTTGDYFCFARYQNN